MPDSVQTTIIPKRFRNRWQSLRRGGTTSTLLRGAGGGFLVNALGTLTALGCHVVLTRSLGDAQYGIFGYVITWTTILVLFASVGIDTSLVRFVPQYRATGEWSLLGGVLRRSSQIVLLGGLVIGGIYALGVCLLSGWMQPELVRTHWIAAAMLPVLAVAGIKQSGLRGLKQIVLSQTPLTVLRPVLVALVVGIAHFGFGIPFDAPAAMLVYAVAVAVSLAASTRWLHRALPEPGRAAAPDYATREWLRVSVPLLLVSGMRILMSSIDILLIGVLIGTTEAGIYIVATRLVRLMTFGLRAGNLIAAPMISELYTENRIAELQRTTYVASCVSTASCLLIGLVLIPARTLALDLFGPAFQAGANVLLILAVGQLVNACTGPVGNLLNMTGFQDVNARIAFIVTALNVLLNYPAILAWGIEGAAVVTSSLLALKNIWTWWEVRRRLGINSSAFPMALAAKT